MRDLKPDPSQTPNTATGDMGVKLDRPTAPVDRTSLAEALYLRTGGADTAKAVFEVSTRYVLSRQTRAMLLDLLAEARGFGSGSLSSRTRVAIRCNWCRRPAEPGPAHGRPG
jgi:hypothetical protein